MEGDRMANTKYTPQIEKFLIDNAANMTVKQAEKLTGIGARRLWRKVKSLGVNFKHSREWSKEDDQVIIGSAGSVRAEDLALTLGRTVNAVRERSRHLNVSLAVARDKHRNPTAIEWVLWVSENEITWDDLINRCGVAKTTIYRIAGEYCVKLKIKQGNRSASEVKQEQKQSKECKKERRKEIMANNSFLYQAWS